MRYTKMTGIFIALSIILNACQKNALEKYSLDQVSSEVFFLHPNDLLIYINQFYNDALFPVYWGQITGNPYRGGADDFNSDNQIYGDAVDDRLNGNRTVTSSTGGGWYFGDVRSINYFFDNYRKCKADFEEYKQYVG